MTLTCQPFLHVTSHWTWNRSTLGTTSVPFAVRSCRVRRSSPVISEVTMKSNHLLTLQTPLVKPKFTIAVSVERCCHPLALWTDTCWFTLVRDPSPVLTVVRHSPPMVTCIDTRGHMVSRPLVMVTLKEKYQIVACCKIERNQGCLEVATLVEMIQLCLVLAPPTTIPMSRNFSLVSQSLVQFARKVFSMTLVWRHISCLHIQDNISSVTLVQPCIPHSKI